MNGTTKGTITTSGEIDLGTVLTSHQSIAGKANNVLGVYYGTCATEQATQAKVVTLTDASGFSLTAGAKVVVKFTNASAAATMTLNVNNTGAKSLMRYGTTTMSNGTTTTGWQAGAIVMFVYDGTNWLRVFWENSTYYNLAVYISTAAGTAAKVGTCSAYTLQKGYLYVNVINANTAASALTLNISSKGAKPIYINGSASSATNYTLPVGQYLVYYNGTNYYFRTDGNIDGPAGGISGTVTIAQGGTGATTAAAARTNLGIKEIATFTYTVISTWN